MDFIPELPESNGYNNILVIIDKLTKYTIFIPTTTTITEKGTAELFFRHVIAQYGIPRQVISDRDTRWKGEFWKEICDQMGMKRALTTAYHPQADGQTEIMNQTLEISLRAYIGPDQDNWVFKFRQISPILQFYASHCHRICTCLSTQRICSNHRIQFNSFARKYTKTLESD
jgi:hypothetical protein